MRQMFSDLQPFRRDTLGFLLDRGKSAHLPLIRLRLGPGRVWLATDSDVVRTVLKASEDTFDKGRFIHKMKPIVGESCLTLSGDEARQRRAALHSTFAKGTAQQFVPQMSAIITAMGAKLATVDEFDAHEVTAPLTLRLICCAMFGKDVLNPGDEQVIIEAVRLVEDDLADELFRVLPRSPRHALAVRRRRQRARAMFDFVVGRVRERASGSSAITALARLGLSAESIRDEIVTMLLAGHHTAGSAGAWVLYHLAVHPHLADQIAAEAASIEEDSISATSLAKAKRSLAFVKEVLRLYPSAHWFSRDVMQHIEVEGVRLHRGDAIIISPWHLQRDPRYWKNPETFDPNRDHANKAYIPFGLGPRTCLGIGVALLELQLLALNFAGAFVLKPKSEVPAPPPTSSVTLVPPRIRLTIEPRTNSHISIQAAE